MAELQRALDAQSEASQRSMEQLQATMERRYVQGVAKASHELVRWRSQVERLEGEMEPLHEELNDAHAALAEFAAHSGHASAGIGTKLPAAIRMLLHEHRKVEQGVLCASRSQRSSACVRLRPQLEALS